MGDLWIAFGLTLFAGMATGIGSAIAFLAKRTNYRFLSVSTGFSAGVMLYVSFVEIFYKGTGALIEAYGDYWGHWVNAGSFFGGIVLMGLIDNLIPAGSNPHETPQEEEITPLHRPAGPAKKRRAPAALLEGHQPRLMRMGLFTALAIAIHNFPEGVSVSVPIYYATGKRSRAFLLSLSSGLAEPIGAGVGYFALRQVFGGAAGVAAPQIMGILFGGVAGIMVYISLDELLPTSRAYGKGHDSLFGLIAGMAVMSLSLLLTK